MLNGFDSSVKSQLSNWLEKIKKISTPKIALFDADGTLWRGDVGESFFEFQVKSGLLHSAPTDDPFKLYWDNVRSGNLFEAYGWLVQWNAGTTLEQMRKWSKDFFIKNTRSQIFPAMKSLVKRLQDHGFEIWVVSASMRWLVEAGAEDFNIPTDRVIGAAVKVKDGVLTSELEQPFPFRQNKVIAVKAAIPHIPTFASGNTFWDKDMLSMVKAAPAASGLALAINSEKPGELNYETEQKLKVWTEQSGWLTQSF